MNTESSEVFELPLRPLQAFQFQRIMEEQKRQERMTIFAVLAHSFNPDAGGAVIRLQARAVDWKTARKIVKLLRVADVPKSVHTDSAAPVNC